jgi:hypothetical protein
MATRARSGAHLAVTINANTSAPSNTIVISSSGNVTTANDLSLTGHLVGYVSNTYLQVTFAQNTATTTLVSDKLQVANAAATYLTKSVALTTNNALINLINDREQIANAAVSYVTKAVHLTTNNALINLINDRYQPANLASDLVSYWPSANIIAYVAAAAGGGASLQTNTSIFIATGGETEVAIPYSNTNHLSVKLNGVRLTPDQDYTAANNTHIGNLIALTAADVLTVTEYKQHVANTIDRSAGGGGGGGFSLQGSTYGYKAGGAGSGAACIIDRFPFASEGTATCVGELVPSTPPDWYGLRSGAGHSSSTDAYQSRYYDGTGAYNRVQKYPFSSESGTIVGCQPGGYRSTIPQNSSTHGYTSGGSIEPPFTSVNQIFKFPFSAETTTTDIGDLTQARTCGAGVSSTTYGYTAGGECTRPGNPTIAYNIIDKYPFASDTNATDVGDLTVAAARLQGVSGPAAGYALGNDILKWPFASDTNATNIGNLVASQATPEFGVGNSCTGVPTQSTTKGYLQSGQDYTPGYSPYPVTKIQAWPFASDTDATCVGDVTVASCQGMGAQI